MPSRLSFKGRPFKSTYERLKDGEELSDLGVNSSKRPSVTSTSEENLQVSDENPISSTQQPRGVPSSRRFSGWRFGALCAAALSFLSLGLNVGAEIWLAHYTKSYRFRSDAVTEIYHGDCSTVEKANTYIHLVINVLSTLLLGGSNYATQCLVAPTRAMLDKAHVRRKWLDIGIPSVRNLRSVSSVTFVLWAALLLSSVPLHLAYNSAIYATIGSCDYTYFIATQGHVNLWKQNLTNYERLNNADCLRAYAKAFVTDRDNVVVVIRNVTDFNPYVQQGYMMCDDRNSSQKYKLPSPTSYRGDEPADACYLWVDQIISEPQNWAIGGNFVDHCLSRRVEEKCGLNANRLIIVTIIVCNAIKCMILLHVAFGLKHEPLIVIGDVVASFLLRPDDVTSGAGLLTRHDVVNRAKTVYIHNLHPDADVSRNSKIFRGICSTRFTAASRTRWIATLSLGAVSILASLALLVIGISSQLTSDHSFAVLWNLGFGRVNANTLIAGGSWSDRNKSMSDGALILTATLLANTPQMVLSIIYFSLNSLVTSVCLAIEWAQFSTSRKSLRVSTPRSSQRSTYFLSIPYRYGIPLLIVSTILHWLVSQSLFLAVVTEVTEGHRELMFATCGYSPIAIVFGVIVGSLLLVGTVAVGVPCLKSQIPVVGSCSLAISAACHPPDDDKEAAFKPVMWGVIPGMTDKGQVAHCTFSSRPVHKLEIGERYR